MSTDSQFITLFANIIDVRYFNLTVNERIIGFVIHCAHWIMEKNISVYAYND